MISKRILVADRNPTFRTTLRLLLEDYGQIGETAAHWPEALAKLARTSYDAVLLDDMLPLVSDLTVLQHIHNLHPSMPVVMITGETSRPAAARALAGGAQACLCKPFDCREFEEVLTRCVGTPK
jgi:CheY-like chemotaxis protein